MYCFDLMLLSLNVYIQRKFSCFSSKYVVYGVYNCRKDYDHILHDLKSQCFISPLNDITALAAVTLLSIQALRIPART